MGTEILAPPPDSPYLRGSFLQFAWDSTSFTTLMECPRKYQLRMLEGWVTRSPNRQVALDFGILMHRGIELYHRLKALGRSHMQSADEACHSILRDPLFDHLPTGADIDAEKEAVAEADDDDGGEANLKQSKVRTRFHLMRALVWYFDHYASDPLRVVQLADGRPAVELSFRVPTGLHIGGEEIIYCGHVDRLVHYADSVVVVDVKTTSKSLGSAYFDLFHISHQMTGYVYAGRLALDRPVSGAMIDGVSLLVGGVKFGRAPTHRSKSQLSEFLQQLGHYTEQAEVYAEDGYYPLNTTSCRFCEFQKICSKSPEVRDLYLHQMYERQPSWNPLQNR